MLRTSLERYEFRSKDGIPLEHLYEYKLQQMICELGIKYRKRKLQEVKYLALLEDAIDRLIVYYQLTQTEDRATIKKERGGDEE